MRGYRRQLGWVWLFVAVLLATLPAAAGENTGPSSGTLTPVDHDPFAPDWGVVAAQVESARFSACMALSAIALQGPKIIGERADFVDAPLLYTEKYVQVTERILKLLDKHCEVPE